VADPSTYRPRTADIPEAPGVYRFSDPHGRVVYVGKAKSLRQRLTSYFADVSQLHPRTQQMVLTASRVEWTVVANEVEALQLEYTWIKEFDPRFNVRYRDDKSYPWLAVTLGEEFPRIQVMRGAKKKGTRYFGPYSHAWAIRETVDQLLRVFPVRTCSSGVFKRAGQVGRPCLLGYIDKCSAPCVGRISAEDHRQLALDFADFVGGNTQRFVRDLERRMQAAAADLDFERAARLRDDLGALRRSLERNAVVLPDGTDADVFALADDELEAAVQVFHVRDGRVRGQRGWVVEKVEDLTTAELVEQLLLQVYGGTTEDAGTATDEAPATTAGVPREILVPELPARLDELTQWLERLRRARVEIRVPQRGDKKSLAETVGANAAQSLALHKTRRAGDLTTRSRALKEIQEALDLPEAPLRIECYDVATLQGRDTVASMVVFEDGLARKSEYRRFAVRGDRGRDDASAMHEVLVRRFRRFLAEGAGSPGRRGETVTDDEPAAQDARSQGRPGDPGSHGSHDAGAVTPRSRRFAYPPNLVVVDGGPPQVAAAVAALAEVGVGDVPVCGLAKRLEEVWVPDDDAPVVLPRASEGLYLLQRVRDEAHRFANTYHRSTRAKRALASELDDVPGLGPARRQALLETFGSVQRLREATPEDLAAVPGIGPRLAATIAAALAPAGATMGGDA
jgi:excinuclease ABC subunit C